MSFVRKEVMKVILPVAGKGSRVQPHSFSKPKPMFKVANKEIIKHMIDHLLTVNPEEFIIIVDKFNGDVFQKKLPEFYPDVKFSFVMQEKQLGPAHAILLAKDHVKEGDKILVVFCDTIFQKDLKCLAESDEKGYDGVIFAQEVEDYKRFGVIVHENMVMKEIIEKPDEPISKLANIGAYYFKDGFGTMNYVQKMVEEGKLVKGEYYLPEAYMIMINDGKRFLVEDVDAWLDVGKIETILSTHAALLKGEVSKAEGVVIENSELGKNVSIGKQSKIINCKLSNTIVGAHSVIEGFEMENSIVGDNVILKKGGRTFNIGDKCYMQ